MTEALAIGAHDVVRMGPGGFFRVTFAYRRRRKGRKWWEVKLWERERVELFWGLIRYGRWRCIRSETAIRRLATARATFETMRAEAEALALGD